MTDSSEEDYQYEPDSDDECFAGVAGFRDWVFRHSASIKRGKQSKPASPDKSELIRDHEHAMQLAKISISKGLKAVSYCESAKGRDSGPLSDLSPITIGDLQEGRRHGGKVLYGTLCVSAFQIKGVFTVLEDESGKAVRVAIYGIPPSSLEEIQKRFPRGQNIAIKEPFYKRADKKLVVRVNNFANIQFLEHVAPQKGDPVLEKLKAEGNSLFGKNDWKGAINAYTKCIDAYKGTSESKELVMQAFSNRSEAWMKLHDYVRALADACHALKFDATHVKSLFRKARALYALQEYEKAQSTLEHAHGNAPDAKDVKEMIHKCAIAINQSTMGVYQLASYLQHNTAEAPECSDYIGPVSIRAGKDGNGLALFATRNVKVGELLLVNNPLAIGRGGLRSTLSFLGFHSSLSHSKHDLSDEVVSVLNNSSRALDQITHLDNAWEEKPVMVPSTELYKPNNNWFSYISKIVDNNENIAKPSVDKKMVRRVVKRHAFGDESASGLWVFASFIRHSCLPNATWLLVGKTLFVHAGRKIQAGEPITAPYFEVLRPVKCRQHSCDNWGFTCSCKRCMFEQSIQKQLPICHGQFEAFFDNALHESALAAHIGCPSEYESELPFYTEFGRFALHVEEAVESLNSLKEEEKQWIKASYASSYFAAFQSLEVLQESLKKLTSGMKIAQALQATVPGHICTLGLVSRIGALAMMFFGEEEPNGGCAPILKLATEIHASLYGVQEPAVVKNMVFRYSRLKLFSARS